MGYITMNRKEREQLIFFEKIKKGAMMRLGDALNLDLTERWVWKKYKRYVSDGAAGLVHRKRHTASSRQPRKPYPNSQKCFL